jgi:NitT/TauT family transport system ATP-binding protein
MIETAPPPHADSNGHKLGTIELSGVEMRFESRRGEAVTALGNVDSTIQAGEFVSFVGPSGCGKSTLLKIIAGLVSPTAGEARIDGDVVTEPRRSVGIMFQTPELFPWRTVLENTLLPIDVFGHRRADHVAHAKSILATVGLDRFANAYPWELSGGMQQRAALSRTLIIDPTILLMDEPFGALDELTRERLNLELLRIWGEYRKTVVFVTHNIGEAVLLSDRVFVMASNPGRILEALPIDLPRPRSIAQTKDRQYNELVFRIRDVLGMPQ